MLIDLNKQINDTFKNVCKPLFENFPISAFVYMEHFNESDFFYLSTDLDWAQDYLANPTIPKLNLPFISQAFSQRHAVSQLGTPQTQANGDTVFSKLNDLGYVSFLNIYKKSNNRIKLWSFVSDDPENSLNFLTTEKEIVEKFVLYFEEKSKAIIPENNRHSSATKLISPMDIHLYDQKNIETQKNNFFESTKFKKISVEHKGEIVKLSSREWDCLKAVSLGYNTKEIAEQLGLSHRTVEQYFNSIRTKTGICSKSEIITLWRNNNFS